MKTAQSVALAQNSATCCSARNGTRTGRTRKTTNSSASTSNGVSVRATQRW
ncbi:hypothetical protein [Nocardioides sp.]|uniref:hypothetical protein n=1 Tax=Nocardioides sp. TaxID=35761 RepID=UPI00352832A4